MVCIIFTVLCFCFLASDGYAQTPPNHFSLPTICNKFDFTQVTSNSNGNTGAPMPSNLTSAFPIFTTFVSCISTTIRDYTYGGDGPSPAPEYLLHAISAHMTPVVAALSIFAIMTHAIRIVGGERNVTASTIKMVIKIAAVNFFYFDMGGDTLGGGTHTFPFAALPFKIMDELAGSVANTGSYNIFSAGSGSFGMHWHPAPAANTPWTPWGELDFLVGIIFGWDPFGWNATNYIDMSVCPTGQNCNWTGTVTDSVRGFAPYNGMLALFGMAAFSGAPGTMLTMAGIMACFEILMFALDIIYVYLLCELVLSLCVIISPFMIPLALWQYTNRFFQKWVATMVGAALVPPLLFGFLWMTLNLLCQPVSDLIIYMNPGAYYDEHHNPWYEPYARKNQEIVSWSQGMSGSFASSLSGLVNGATATASKAHTPAIGQFMDSRGSAKTLANSSMLGTFDQMGWGLNLVGANKCPTSGPIPPCCQDKSCNSNGQNCVSAPSCSNQDKNVTHAIFAALTLFVFASVLVGLCKQIPSVAQQIGGSMAGIGFKERGAFPKQMMQSKIGQMSSADSGGSGGGSFGSMLAARAGKSKNAQSGAAKGGSLASDAKSGLSSLIGNRP